MENKETRIAIIVGVKLDSNDNFAFEMEELRGLAKACNLVVREEVVQTAKTFNNKTYIRSGKVSELKELIEMHNASYCIFNDELSGAVLNNLSKQLDCIIYDRTYLILEIFKSRAHTKEARLQVDIASLIYMKSRLVGLREGLSRQRGGSSGGGAYGKGRGETQLEIDRRNISERIVLLRKELKQIIQERKTQRKRRTNSNIPIVCLVGYTNAGKSSILNRFMDFSKTNKKEVFEKDMLFATLETSSRLITLKNNHSFILTDTVGFISKLPTMLVEAFKSTLEEISEADLLIHVIDSSNVKSLVQINTTNEVLDELGAKGINTIYVFNKTDKVTDSVIIPKEVTDYCLVSALTLDGMDELQSKIDSLLFPNEETVTLLIPYDKAGLLTKLKNNANVLSILKCDDGLIVNVIIGKELKKEYIAYIKKA